MSSLPRRASRPQPGMLVAGRGALMECWKGARGWWGGGEVGDMECGGKERGKLGRWEGEIASGLLLGPLQSPEPSLPGPLGTLWSFQLEQVCKRARAPTILSILMDAGSKTPGLRLGTQHLSLLLSVGKIQGGLRQKDRILCPARICFKMESEKKGAWEGRKKTTVDLLHHRLEHQVYTYRCIFYKQSRLC